MALAISLLVKQSTLKKAIKARMNGDQRIRRSGTNMPRNMGIPKMKYGLKIMSAKDKVLNETIN
jgi:hypothetical protein